jgi:hypothetical protein
MFSCEQEADIVSIMTELPSAEKFVKKVFVIPYSALTFCIYTEKDQWVVQAHKGLSEHCWFTATRIGDSMTASGLLYPEMLAVISGGENERLQYVATSNTYTQAENSIAVMRKLGEIKDFWKASDISYSLLTEDMNILHIDVVPVKDKDCIEEPLFVVSQRQGLKTCGIRLLTVSALATHAKSI